MNRLARLWFGPLPSEHRRSLLQILYHPLKRWVAKGWLVLLRRFFGLKVVALTGTAGKTTTKEMIAALLATQYRVVASHANIDPVYNIPSSIFKCSPTTQYLVLEMGVEYPGEMNFYLWLTGKPDVGIITNIGAAHTEFFGSVDGVLAEKMTLLRGLPKESYAILNFDDKRLREACGGLNTRVVTYGIDSQADLFARGIDLTPDFKTRFTLGGYMDKPLSLEIPLLGRQFVQNALAAVAVAKVLGLSEDHLLEGLTQVKPMPHRLNPVRLSLGTVLLDDTYNSNPTAACASLEVLREVASTRKTIAVLGEMKELGEYSLEGHRQVGQRAGELGLDVLIGFTMATEPLVEAARNYGVRDCQLFETKEDLLYKLHEILTGSEVLLIKGSRALKMEEIVDDLRRN